jgi:hypothetical protein
VSAPRVLTVRPPWAAQIIWGGKQVEHRSWPTSHRGLLWIHQGIDFDREATLAAVLVDDRYHRPRGLIIGHVHLTGCELAAPGCYHWLLCNPVPLAPPLPARGWPGLWRVPAGLQS